MYQHVNCFCGKKALVMSTVKGSSYKVFIRCFNCDRVLISKVIESASSEGSKKFLLKSLLDKWKVVSKSLPTKDD